MSGKTNKTKNNRPHPIPIAVVGVGALFPGSNNVTGFWQDILAGRDLITEVPSTHWLIEDHYDSDPAAPDKTYSKRGAFLSPTDFDPMEFGIPPSNLSSTDTSQLLALIVAKQVLNDAAQGAFKNLNRDRISVILGVAAGLELLGEMVSRIQQPMWVKALRENGMPEDQVRDVCNRISNNYVPWKESTFPGLLGNVIAGRIANHFDLGGTNCTVDAACASSLSALSMAMNELYLGQSDVVITGGVDTTNGPFMYTCFSKTPALSRSDDCRPFSDKSDGLMLGEGLGMVALKRLEDAERDADRIYAVIKGVGASSDGTGTSVFSPLPEGQAKALRRCYKVAGYDPSTVELIEAHGTGTIAGDLAEFEGLCMVFNETDRKDRNWCALGSVKSQIGHTKSAAGAAGLIKAILALHNKVLPPTIKVDRPDPRLDLNRSPFYLNTKARPWIRDASHPRRASISSFGFGGANFHVTAEEYTGPGNHARQQRAFPSELLLFASESEQGLATLCQKQAEDLHFNGILPFLAQSSQQTFNFESTARLAVVATDEIDLAKKIKQVLAAFAQKPGESFSLPNGIHYRFGDSTPGLVAYMFPGQGSQYIGMGADLAMHRETARAIWNMAAEIRMDDDIALHEVVFPHPVFSKAERMEQAHRLTRTEWAQPAISTVSLSMLALLESLGIRKDCVGGHSLGEVSALVAANMVDASSVLKIARRRGELMAEAASVPGAMTAVFQSLEKVRFLLELWNSKTTVANHNGPNQVVLSGPVPAIEQVENRLAEQEIQFQRLSVATAFHSPLVSDCCGPFFDFLKGFSIGTPDIPLYSNSEAAPYPNQMEGIRQLLAKQINHPVRFVEQINAMYAQGVRTFVEVGPGNVLTELVDKCLEDQPHLAVNMDRKDQHGITSLWNCLGRLAINGVVMDFNALWQNHSPATDPRQKEASALAVPIMGCNYGKPYPPPEGAKTLPKPNLPETGSPSSQTGRLDIQPANISVDNQAILEQESQRDESTPMTRCDTSRHPGPGTVDKGPPISRRNGDRSEWLNAFKELQRQTADTHAAFQKSMADNHKAFLKTAEASAMTLNALITGQQPHDQETPLPGDNPVSDAFPELDRSTDVLPDDSMIMPPAQPPVDTLDLHVSAGGPAVQQAAAPRAARVSIDPVPKEMDYEELLISVVAEKTGYPADILNLEMGLESDLGIDSIKRVEILSAIKDQAPWLPEVDTGEMANIRTMGDVLDYMERTSGHPEADNQPEDKSPIPANADSSKAAAPVDLGRYTVQEVSAPRTGFAMAGLISAERAVVTDDGSGVAQALVNRLKALNIPAQVTDHVSERADVIIFLGGLRRCPNPDSAIAVNREAFRAARIAAQRMIASGGVFVSVQDTGGDFGLAGSDETRAWLAGLTGLIKTAAIEWPLASLKAIDLERGNRSADQIADALSRELIHGGPDIEVGLHADGRRTCLQSLPAALRPLAMTVDHRSILVVSGGGRGITAAALIELARRFQPRIALLGRTPLIDEPAFCRGCLTQGALNQALLTAAQTQQRAVSLRELNRQTRQIFANREIRSTLRALREAGSDTRYIAVDVKDASDVTASLESIRRQWGPITGIVHGAGILNDKLIAEKTAALFDPVFDTKVQGLRALLDASTDDPLKVICLFSSVAARFGNMGQCDYAMANEVLNKVANAEARRRKGGCVVKSLNWGPWDGGMVSPEHKSRFHEMGIPLISLDAGARCFVDEIQEVNSDHVEVVLGQASHQADLSTNESNRKMTLALWVRQSEYPYFDSHRIKDLPVVPMAMVLEWFLRAAHLWQPNLRFRECKDLQVLKGIRLQGFHNGGEGFMVSGRQDFNGDSVVMTLELLGSLKTIHYSAVIEMAAPDKRSEKAVTGPSREQLAPWSLRLSEIYTDWLFHGPDFQMIRSLKGISENAASVILAGTREMGWSGNIWKTDAAALDGGLQAAVLWSEHFLGRQFLPTRIGAYISRSSGEPVEGLIRCELRGRVIRNARTISDIFFFDEKRDLVAKMSKVEMHKLPEAG
jgi:acyl transferase domain-containing protein/NAD(P)-dependent dehydrogenase (short-subunit alcohol dehydrogenase family)/acyl carrier protein